MTTPINVHEFDELQPAIQWLIPMAHSGLIIPLQPLFINGCPNILPLSYFFPEDPKTDYDLHHALMSSLTTHAPPSIGHKSCKAIANDLHLHGMDGGMPMAHAYDWLHQAVTQFKRTPLVLDVIKQRKNRHQMAAQWINTHYNGLFIFGIHSHQRHIVLAFIDHLTIPVHWVVPSGQRATHRCDRRTIDAWFDAWATTPIQQPPLTVHAFDSISDECHTVLDAVQSSPHKVALVTPNETIKSWVTTAGIHHGIQIKDSHTKLKDTAMGYGLMRLVHWIKHPTLQTFQQVIYAWPSPSMATVKSRINLAVAATYTSKTRMDSVSSLFSDIPSEHMVHAFLAIQSLQDLHSFFQTMDIPFSMDDSDYFRYQCKEAITHLLNHAHSMSEPWSYIDYMVQHTAITSKALASPHITCVLPEELCKLPAHAVWVLGFGHSTWGTASSAHYLTADSMIGLGSEATALRQAMGRWAITHSNLMGISYATTINDIDNHLMDNMSANTIHTPSNPSPPYKRPAPIIQGSLTFPKVSPSQLNLYQRCPYAFFIQCGLGFTKKQPVTDPQQFGHLIHYIIEQMAKGRWQDTNDVSDHLQREFNPLMATVMQHKIDSEWALEDIQSLLHGFSGTIATEQDLSTQIHGVTISGRADLILENPNDTEIIDIKTGQLPSTKDIQTLQYIQLGLYMLMLNSTPQSKITASFIGKNATYKPVISVDPSTDTSYLSDLTAHVTQLLDGIQSHKFSPNHHVGHDKHRATQCRACDVYHACSYKDRHHR